MISHEFLPALAVIVASVILPMAFATITLRASVARGTIWLLAVGLAGLAVLLYLLWWNNNWFLVGAALALLVPVVVRPLNMRLPITLGWMMRRVGVMRVEKRIDRDGTSTEEIIKSAREQLEIVAFASTKFVVRHELLRHICTNGRGCRFLLAQPESTSARDLSKRWGYEDDKLSAVIRENLRNWHYLRGRGWNVDVRFYPVDVLSFRVIIVDRRQLYITYYKARSRGLDLPQLVLRVPDDDQLGFVSTLLVTFDELWRRGKTIEWQRYPAVEPTRKTLA